MFSAMLTVMTVLYTISHPSFALIQIKSQMDKALFVSIVHIAAWNRQVCSDIYEFLGNESSARFEVEDKDVLIIVAKRNEAIVASQVYEVDLVAVSQGYLLVPRGGFNVLCSQNEVDNHVSAK